MATLTFCTALVTAHRTMTSLEATEAKVTIPNYLKLVLKVESFELKASFNAVSRSFTVWAEGVV